MDFDIDLGSLSAFFASLVALVIAWRTERVARLTALERAKHYLISQRVVVADIVRRTQAVTYEAERGSSNSYRAFGTHIELVARLRQLALECGQLDVQAMSRIDEVFGQRIGEASVLLFDASGVFDSALNIAPGAELPYVVENTRKAQMLLWSVTEAAHAIALAKPKSEWTKVLHGRRG